jgi:putative phosphoesterase
MKRIGLISDTHSFLDEAVFNYFKNCDEIWHAGDIGSVDLADKLIAFKPFRAVYGNIDGAPLRRMFPLDLRFLCEGLDVYITHIGGYPGNYNQRVRQQLAENAPDLFICGHSHILKVMPDKQFKLLHMNPGAAGIHGFHLKKTLLRFTVNEGKVSDLEAIELGDRATLPLK